VSYPGEVETRRAYLLARRRNLDVVEYTDVAL